MAMPLAKCRFAITSLSLLSLLLFFAVYLCVTFIHCIQVSTTLPSATISSTSTTSPAAVRRNERISISSDDQQMSLIPRSYVTWPTPLFLLTDTVTLGDRRDARFVTDRRYRSRKQYIPRRRTGSGMTARYQLTPSCYVTQPRRQLIIRPESNLDNIDSICIDYKNRLHERYRQLTLNIYKKRTSFVTLMGHAQ